LLNFIRKLLVARVFVSFSLKPTSTPPNQKPLADEDCFPTVLSQVPPHCVRDEMPALPACGSAILPLPIGASNSSILNQKSPFGATSIVSGDFVRDTAARGWVFCFVHKILISSGSVRDFVRFCPAAFLPATPASPSPPTSLGQRSHWGVDQLQSQRHGCRWRSLRFFAFRA
jgi:hypothetical protein